MAKAADVAFGGHQSYGILESSSTVRQHPNVGDLLNPQATDMQYNGFQHGNVSCTDVELDTSHQHSSERFYSKVLNEDCIDKITTAVEQPGERDELKASKSSMNCANSGQVVISSHVTSPDVIRHRLIQTACLCSCMLALVSF